MKGKSVILTFALLLMLLFVSLAYFYKTISVNYNQKVDVIAISMRGGVKIPGVYYVEKGSPISLVLNKSGGLKYNSVLPKDFDFNTPLYDDITVIIPSDYSFER